MPHQGCIYFLNRQDYALLRVFQVVQYVIIVNILCVFLCQLFFSHVNYFALKKGPQKLKMLNRDMSNKVQLCFPVCFNVLTLVFDPTRYLLTAVGSSLLGDQEKSFYLFCKYMYI